MFANIAGFEFRYQLRQPLFWAALVIYFSLAFAGAMNGEVRNDEGGNLHMNAPYFLGRVTIVLLTLYLFVMTAFVANVVVRDDETGFGPIIRTTRVTKNDYLMGRFSGAFAAAALGFTVVPLGILAASYMPWVDPQTVGPNGILTYAYVYFLLAVPTLFAMAAVLFAAATATRSMMWTYVCVIAFLIVFSVTNASLGRKPELEKVFAYVEPFGGGAFRLATRYWTGDERNSVLPTFTGALLWGRVIWVGIGFAALTAAHALFRFAEKGAVAKRNKKRRALAVSDSPLTAPGPLPAPSFNVTTALAQFFAQVGFETRYILKSPAYFVLLALGILLSIAAVVVTREFYGTEIYPVTRLMIQALSEPFTLISTIIAAYYAGELVWRDRERKAHEIIGSTAAPDWAFLLPKALAIAVVLTSTVLVSVIAAMLMQALKGYVHFEIAKYVLWYVIPRSIDFGLIAVLAIFLQLLSPNKFVGWGLTVIVLIVRLSATNIGLQDVLYQFGTGPSVPLSDMNGQGQFWQGAYWLRAYWTAFSVLLLIVGSNLWRRGTETRLVPALRRLPQRLRGMAGVASAGILVVFVLLGALIYQNTHVWNQYRTADDDDRRQAAAERALLRYENVPEPSVVSVVLKLELYPHDLRLLTRGRYVLQNRTGTPLQNIHIRTNPDTTRFVDVDVPGAYLEREYPEFNYRIYRLRRPLAPGKSMTVNITTLHAQRGFRNNRPDIMVVDNGTFINSLEFGLRLGISRADFLSDPSKRRKYGLPPQLRVAKLEDNSARNKNYVDNADWVSADITVTTDADQTPIAPGYKARDDVKNGRRTAEFRSESPILNFFSVQSARYVEKHEIHNGIDVGVFYDAQHPYNIERMIHAGEVALDYYQSNFSRYQFRQIRFMEFPDYEQSAEAFANTVPWSEGLGFIADVRNPDKIDYVTLVAAHELGHQWWAHQVVSADMQGATMLTETLAQYSAMMVMEKLYGPDQMRKFLKYEQDEYLRARSTEAVEEVPLERVENQAYIHYHKGAVVMYLLKDQIGEAAVNRALRKLLARYAFKGPPYASSKDLVALFRAEAPTDKQQLITDLFERITLYDVVATQAVVRKRADGKYLVHLTVRAKKLYADGKGREHEAPMTDESFDVGVFGAVPGKANFGAKDVMAFHRVLLSSGVHTFDLVVEQAPAFAGIDPYNKRIDRNPDDNVIKVER